MRVTVAARRSALARLQAQTVSRALGSIHPQLEFNYRFSESLGDRRLDAPLWKLPEKGVFTEDLRAELIAGVCDLIVHSWKDLPVEDNPLTEIVATLPRADRRDLLLVRSDRWEEISRRGKISLLTSSPRRAQNLKSFLPEALPGDLRELEFIDVRGNIQTRVGKLLQQDVDGLVLAKAALDRLLETKSAEFAETKKELRQALSKCNWMVLPLSANPTAPAQGALAVEIAHGRADLRELLDPVNCKRTFEAVTRERQILRQYGGGCHQAIGVSVLDRPYGEITIVRGLDQNGCELSQIALQPGRPHPPRIDRAQIWPLTASENEWYDREPIYAAQPGEEVPLWIAKADALPESWGIPRNQIVWTSGLGTWRRLARRGVWVNGSAESLGEDEPPQIETLVGGPISWLKLSHSEIDGDGGMPALATYRLIPRNSAPDLKGKEYFFWRSGSSFSRAIELNPELRWMTHFCGPGNTQKALLKLGVDPYIYLDHRQWLEEITL